MKTKGSWYSFIVMLMITYQVVSKHYRSSDHWDGQEQALLDARHGQWPRGLAPSQEDAPALVAHAGGDQDAGHLPLLQAQRDVNWNPMPTFYMIFVFLMLFIIIHVLYFFFFLIFM